MNTSPGSKPPAPQVLLFVDESGELSERPMNAAQVEVMEKSRAALLAAAAKSQTARIWLRSEALETVAETLGYTCLRSASLAKRTDGSLKGSIVLIADCNDHDATIQEEITLLLAPFVDAGRAWRTDKLLVEASPDGLKARFTASHGWAPMATCIGIDSDGLRRQLSTAMDEAYAHGVAMLEALGAVGHEPAVQALAREALSIDGIMTVWLHADESRREQTVQDFFDFYVSLDACLAQTRSLEEQLSKHFLQQIHAHAGPDHVTCVVLDLAHVRRIKDDLLKSSDAIVLARASHLGLVCKDPKELASWKDASVAHKVGSGHR